MLAENVSSYFRWFSYRILQMELKPIHILNIILNYDNGILVEHDTRNILAYL